MILDAFLLIAILLYCAWKVIVHLPQILMWLVAVVVALFALHWVIIILAGITHGIEVLASFLYDNGWSILWGFGIVVATMASISVTYKYSRQKKTAVLVLPPDVPSTVAPVASPQHPERVGLDHERDFYSL